MPTSTPLPLFHSWPLWDEAQHFDLGRSFDSLRTEVAPPPVQPHLPGIKLVGLWECDLANNALIWSPEVYEIFGLSGGAAVTRPEAVACYSERSRSAMERLRAHSIKHRRGFTIDVDIRPGAGKDRRVRLIGAPICDGGQVVRLRGLKILM